MAKQHTRAAARPEAADWFPLSAAEHRAQVTGLLRRLGRSPRRVLDLGCGDGRVAVPIAAAGHAVMAMDRDPAALRGCRVRAREAGALGRVALRRADFAGAAFTAARFDRCDAVLCLGHTFMQVNDPVRAAGLLRRLRAAMSPGRRAFFAIDDLCDPLWREVAEGRWQEGVSEDGDWQLLWAGGDNEIVLRRGRAVRPSDWRIRPSEKRLRLWSMGELRLLAHASGWGPPRRSATDHLIVFAHRP